MLDYAQRFVDLLDEKELKYFAKTDEDGDAIVDFPYDGKMTKCIFSGDKGEYLSLYMVYESVPEDKYAEMLIICNTLNAKYKWIKLYIDNDSDLMVQDDAILSDDNTADEAFELLLRFLDIVKECKPTIMKALYA